MTISEIENLSYAELKARREELIEAAAADDGGVLAQRYVQARTDAKLRDEKLAEQGQTIDALKAGYAALQEKSAAQDAQIKELETKLQDALKRVSEDIASLQDAKQQIGAEMMRADQCEALAKARRVALASIMQIISPVLAAE